MYRREKLCVPEGKSSVYRREKLCVPEGESSVYRGVRKLAESAAALCTILA